LFAANIGWGLLQFISLASNFGPNVKSSQISHCSLQQQQYILLVPRKLGYARVETQYDPPAKREKKEKYIQASITILLGI
jgi:hypothetical protein